jgi:hypothetical protein
MQGEKQMVTWKARLRVKASFEVKSKVMKEKVVPCRVLRPDDWIVRVVDVLRWGWGGCRCVGVEDDKECRGGREGRLGGGRQGGFW